MMKTTTQILFLFILSHLGFAQTVKRSKIVSNGGVHGMAYHPKVGMVVLHSGTHLGFPALNAQEVDKETGNPISVDFPFIDGFYDGISDDNGGWYITKGGTFYKVDEYTFPANKYTEILHIKSDYSIDTTFRVQKNNVFPTNFYGGILKILKYQNILLAWCGNGRLLAFDVTTGSYLWDSKTEASFQNLKMQLSQNRLYIAGNFTKVDDINTTTTKAICFDLDTRTLTNWNPTATLNLQGYNITDMALSGGKMIFCSADYTKVIATDTTLGTTKYWEEIYNDFNPQKLVADNSNVYLLSQNRHFDVVWEDYSKIAKINAGTGQMDNSWTISTNYSKKLYNLYLDQNHLYATADEDVTVLGRRTSCVVKINKITRTTEDWKPFNDPVTNGVSPQTGLGVEVASLKLLFKNSSVLIGGNYPLMKQIKKEGIAIIRPESESVVNWSPNIKSIGASVAAFENDSTLWVWGSMVLNNNQFLVNHFAAFDIRTGDLLRHFPSNLFDQYSIKKMVIAEGKVITTNEYSGNSSGVRGFLISYDSQSGIKENWFTGGGVNNFFVVDSLLYCSGSLNIAGVYKNGLFSINLKNNQYTNWTPAYPPDFNSGTLQALSDFVITGKSIVVISYSNSSKLYYEFDRFNGKLLNSFGQIGDRGTYITAGEKYFFIARNGYNYYQADRCGDFTSAFLFDLEYKKFSNDCFLKKPFPQDAGNYQLPSAYIDRQFFLAQNYLYFNLSWSGRSRPIGYEQGNFLRTSFPKGFFKDEINPAFFPKVGGNGGDVTINFYGYSFIEGCKIKLKKVGQLDLIVPDSMINFPEKFRMEAIVNLRGKSTGDWDIEVLLPNHEILLFPKGFKIVAFNTNDIVVNIKLSPILRLGAKRTVILEIANKGFNDIHGSTIWIAISKDSKFNLKVPFTRDSSLTSTDSLYYVQIDSLEGKRYNKKLYWLFVPNLKSRSVLEIPCSVTPLSLDTLTLDAWVGKPFYGSPLTDAGLKCLSSVALNTLEILWDEIPELLPFKATIKNCVVSLYTTVPTELIRTASDKNMTTSSKLGDMLGTTFNYVYNCVKEVAQFTPAGRIGKVLKVAFKGYNTFMEGYNASQKGIEYAMKSIEIANDCSPLIPLLKNKVEVFALVRTSIDPNDKLGPIGVKPQRYVNSTNPFNYKIRFENYATATAAAQYVRVVDTLDRTKFNFDTFQFGHFNVADTNFYASPGKKRHLVDWDLRPTKDLILRMEAKFIDSTGILEATYTALDPATMEWTEDPILGFLPPNVNAPEGEGSLTFSIFPKDSLATGTTVTNKAYIYFDYNPVIPTPPWTNTIDATLPISNVVPLSSISRDTTLVLSWQGSDGESGAKLYDVMVSVNNQEYKPILLATHFTTFNFVGKADSTYKFYTMAYDSVYNKEPVKITFDTQTTIKYYPMIQSITSGDWNNTATWDCNCVPTAIESVIIKNSHRILITPAMGNVGAKNVTLEAGAILEQNGVLKLKTD